jgi:hypothetical protein
VFSNDVLIEKFHHFLHVIISTTIEVIYNFCEDQLNDFNGNQNESDQCRRPTARSWSLENKEKLFFSLVKIFSLNMPLYVTYKHLLFNHGRYCRIKECSCSLQSIDSIKMLHLHCQTMTLQQQQQNNHQNGGINDDLDNLPIELLRNICHFIELNGFIAIKKCFNNSKITKDDVNDIFSNDQTLLPVQIAHLLFSFINNIRPWLNQQSVEDQIVSMRSVVIKYMCHLSDKDLRLASTKNTTELMYDTFKNTNNMPAYEISIKSSKNGKPKKRFFLTYFFTRSVHFVLN